MTPIAHVSETALWVAAVRANESKRADAVFKEPLASLLAGKRGFEIARSLSRRSMVSWGLVARTSAIDRLLEEAIREGVDTVLNIGAGMDTRPYRLQLPADLRWIELDFPEVMASKSAQLAGHASACILERIGLDISDRALRKSTLARCAASSSKLLAITEGVLPYLSNEEAAALAADLFEIEACRYWIQDFDNAGQRKQPPGWAKMLEAAPILFAVKNWFEFFGQLGWNSKRTITTLEESERIRRPYPLDFPYGLLMRALPREWRRKILSLSGAVLLSKA